jgi:hypothetical protein
VDVEPAEELADEPDGDVAPSGVEPEVSDGIVGQVDLDGELWRVGESPAGLGEAAEGGPHRRWH